MLIELHILQNFAPSNLNRDDTNNPKDCEFGGVRRARISSQCLKRSIRSAPIFQETTAVENGTRTRWITRKLCEALRGGDKPVQEVESVVNSFALAYSGKMDREKASRTAVLLYLSPEEIQWSAKRLAESWDEINTGLAKGDRKGTLDAIVKELIKTTKDRTSAPDIALFGRMLADKPEVGLDAACQVAHAISTHRVAMEMDFFTAVDDLQQDEESGAGMMGFTGFNSACFYRYACLDWGQLVKNLDGDEELARRTVEGFLRASISAIPTGKQNSFAAHNPPSFLLAVVRDGNTAWNLVNAFEKSVRPGRDSGLTGPSIQAMDAFWGRLVQVYGEGQLVQTAALALDPDPPLKNLKDSLVEDLPQWIQRLTGAITRELAL